MGKSRKIKIKRLADEIFDKYPERVSVSYDENKQLIDEILVGSSKTIRNMLTGHLTRRMNQSVPL
ncbi:MAG: 30S ribosomal protein S17e [Candidatus Bathyarchaeota archaeon]|nr:30S ribosomal protein S17e [Candidatus Bathyarchaeota archaeon]